MGLRYSQGKYGQFKYGLAEAGFQFKVQISDSTGALQTLLNNEVKELSWTYNRMGGCDKFRMLVKRQYTDFTNLTHRYRREFFDLQVWVTSAFGGTSTLYYRGFITNIRPNLKDGEETIVTGVGYAKRLDEIQINNGSGAPKTYTNTTISGVVTSLANDFITSNTPITAGTVDTFSTTVTSISFNGTAKEAFDKLASLVDAEWGVDSARQIYFRSKSTSVGWRFMVGKDIGRIEDELDYTEIVNRVYIEGGLIAGVPYRYTKSNAASIALFGLKEKRITNSSVIDSTVADVLATSILKKYESYVRNPSVELPFNKSKIETNNPLDLVVICDQPKLVSKKYATFKYGEGNLGYSDETKYRIESIEYELRDVSMLTTLNLNEGKPDLDNMFEALMFDIEQQRQSEGV